VIKHLDVKVLAEKLSVMSGKDRKVKGKELTAGSFRTPCPKLLTT